MWFTEVATVADPGRDELIQFVQNIEDFLTFVLEENELGFLWEDEPELRGLAWDTFNNDVKPSAGQLREAIPSISDEQLNSHGLIGGAMRFKLRVVDSIGRLWGNVRGAFSVGDWLKRMFGAIDAALDSLIQAAGGAGGLLMEFKKSLASLAKTA